VSFGEVTRIVEKAVSSQEAWEIESPSEILEFHEEIKRRVRCAYV